MTRTNARGFALIELMVIVAVLSLAASFFVPRFLKHQIKTRQMECSRNLHSFYDAEKAHHAAKGSFAPDLATLGWAPIGHARYEYKMLKASKNAFVFECSGNIDTDPTLDTATIDESGVMTQTIDDIKK